MSTTPAIHASRTIPAPARRVYDVIADYNVGHPSILPRPPFGALNVEAGGVGAGTTIRFEMRMLGKTRVTRGEITEPEPGRVLVETYPDSGMVTTFLVQPRGAAECEVTISTEIP